jgi:hypothetical protein
MIFLYIKRIHSLEAPTSDSPATTGRRLQPPVLRLQPEGSYNSLNSLAPTRRRLQPPEFSGSNQKVATTTYPCPIQPPCNINVDQLSLSQTLPLSLPLSLSLTFSFTVTLSVCHLSLHCLINLYLHQPTNTCAIPCINCIPTYILSHASIMNQRYINKE